MRLSVFYDHILQASAQTGKPLPELLNGVRDAGIEAVEINMSYLCEHEETCELLGRVGLRISCVYEFYEMEQKDEKRKAEKQIHTALKAGAGKVLVVPGFLDEEEAHVMKEYVTDYDKTADFLNHNEKALRMAEGLWYMTTLGTDAGIEVTVEDFDDARSPLSSVNGMRWFFEHIPDLRGTFDTGNFIIHGEDIQEAWKALKERIVHIHCKDRGARPVAVGDGDIPMSAVMKMIEKSGYAGYLAIEHFDAADQEKCIRNSAAFLKRLCGK